MKKKLFSILKYVFFLGLGFFLVWWQFNKMTSLQLAQFEDSLKNANYLLVLPIVIMAILSHISRAIRWKILIEPMGYRPSTANSFYCVMSGYVANTFLPRAGEFLKCSLLSRYEKIPLNKLLGTILIERAFDLACYFILIIITILIQLDHVSNFLKEKLLKLDFNKVGISLWQKALIAVIIIVLLVIIIRLIVKKFSNNKHVTGLKTFHIGIKEGFNSIMHLKKGKWFIAHTLFIWTMYLMEIYIGFSALSATSHLGVTQAFSVLSLATLGMIISPGGIGAFPLAVQEVLLIYNVDNVSFGWLIWGVTTAIVIVVGLLSFGLLIYKNKKRHEAKQPGVIQNIYN